MKKGMIFVFVMVLVFCLSGCATKGDFTSLIKAVNVDLIQLSKKMDEVGTKIEELSAKKILAPATVSAPAVNTPKEEKVAPVTPVAPPPVAAPTVAPIAPEVITSLESRMSALESKTSSLETHAGRTDSKVDLLSKQVAALRIRVVKVNQSVGAALELTGKSGERYFLIGPFRSGSADVKGLDGQLKRLSALMEKEGLVATKIVGFADNAPFKSAKDAAENETKNLELAKSRASAVAKALDKMSDGAEILGRGTTEQFDGRAANRCVMVVVAKKATAPAAPAPATPPTPPVASPPTK